MEELRYDPDRPAPGAGTGARLRWLLLFVPGHPSVSDAEWGFCWLVSLLFLGQVTVWPGLLAGLGARYLLGVSDTIAGLIGVGLFLLVHTAALNVMVEDGTAVRPGR